MCRGRSGLTRWHPVVFGPSTDVPALVVLRLQPVDERLEVSDQWQGGHAGLTGEQGHGFRPRLAGTQFHDIPAQGGTQSGSVQLVNSEQGARYDSLLFQLLHANVTCSLVPQTLTAGGAQKDLYNILHHVVEVAATGKSC